ncbi:bifunctional NUDIX hydrolase/phosphatase PAP2 family protein [Photobacterium lucens]|uniref:bifunctional NUDIX hydrolase/phosphatase PAP2 family protein n=1 Tax=Photobacterium lucens TaxID=2562949 RepID=UPI001F246796|nr:phosphatase PAP2 family protein [Photobacterium lucens]
MMRIDMPQSNLTVFKSLLGILSFILFFFSALPAQAIPLVGSACVIRHGDKVLVIKEEISGKLALPGGQIDPNDTPEQAAVREVYEETGLHVEAVKLLKLRGNTTVFACVAKQPIPTSKVTPYLKPLAKIDPDDLLVSAWQAKHFAKEVKRVYLLSVDNITKADYRYPNDVPLLSPWLKQVPESAVTDNGLDYQSISPLHQWELHQIQAFQQTIKSSSELTHRAFSTVLWVFNLPGEKLFIGVLLLIAAIGFGTTGLLALASILLSVTFTASVMKLWLASPRPFYIWPELQQASASGFGLPSGHTFMATVLWLMLWYSLPLFINRFKTDAITDIKVFRMKVLPLFILAIVLQAVARVWLGVHFMSDTLLGVTVGTLLALVLIQWQRNGLMLNNIWNWRCWALFSAVIFVAVCYFQVPQQVYLLACTLAISSVVFVLHKRQDNTIAWSTRFFLGCSLIMAVVVISAAGLGLSHIVISTAALLLIKVITVMALVGATFALTDYIYRRYGRKTY